MSSWVVQDPSGSPLHVAFHFLHQAVGYCLREKKVQTTHVKQIKPSLWQAGRFQISQESHQRTHYRKALVN